LIVQTVTVKLDPDGPNSARGLGYGYEQETGDEVLFAGDVERMTWVANALIDGHPVTCGITPEQVIFRGPREPVSL
jgi:hypothetical protein